MHGRVDVEINGSDAGAVDQDVDRREAWRFQTMDLMAALCPSIDNRWKVSEVEPHGMSDSVRSARARSDGGTKELQNFNVPLCY